MRKLIAIISLVAAHGLANAQEESTSCQHQLSINATTFVKNFFSFNSNSAGSSPYQLMYRCIGANGSALRAQLGLQYFQSNAEDTDGDDNSTLTGMITQSSIGYEKRKEINKRWLYYFGGQAMFNYRSDITKNVSGSSESTNKSISYGVGIGGVAGVQFNINDRLSLGTEAGLPVMYTVSKVSSEFNNDLSTSTTKLVSMLPSLPQFIYFNINL